MKKFSVLILALIALSGCGSTDVNAKSPQTSTESSPSVKENTESTVYNAGHYVVGETIPEGEYKLITENENSGYYEENTSITASEGKIISNESFNNFTYAHLTKGNYLELTRAKAIPFKEAEKYKDKDLITGMYKVGFDIPEGVYEAVVAEGKDTGYFSVITDPADKYNTVVDNENFEKNALFEARKGQYVIIQRATAKFVKKLDKESLTTNESSSTKEVVDSSEEEIAFKIVSYDTLSPQTAIGIRADKYTEINTVNSKVDSILENEYWDEQYEVEYKGAFNDDGLCEGATVTVSGDVMNKIVVDTHTGNEEAKLIWETAFMTKYTDLSKKLPKDFVLSVSLPKPAEDTIMMMLSNGNVLENKFKELYSNP